MSENTLEIYQEEDVTKIINKSLEVKDGKLTEKGWSDISKTLQAYSDKRFETARYLFVQNGKIIRHVAISVQNPNATISKPDENVTYLEKLKTFAQNTNSSVVFVHNHPSGYVEPSLADQDTTQYLHNFFGDLFAGHIILDHGKFGIYEPKNQKWQALIDNKIYEMEEGKTHFSIHGSQIGIKQITNEKDLSILANYAKKIDNQANWNRDDWIPAFYATHHGIIQSLEYIQNEELKVENYQGLTNQIKYVGRDVGCNYIYLVPKTLEQKMLCEAFAQKTRIVQDIYFEKEDGTYELSNYSGGDIFSSLTKDEIKMDDSINYEIINEEDKDIMEKKEQNPWFEKLSDIEKEAVLSDMRINPDLIGEYHSELAEANIDYKEYDRPSDEWFLNKINYKNLDGEFSYFNENNIGQQRHYAEVINEYKQDLAAKQEINDEVMDVNDSLPETALEADYEEDFDLDNKNKEDKDIIDNENEIENKEDNVDDDFEDYIHSAEFIQKFGDWEKANRLEKLKKSESLIIDSQIIIKGNDVTAEINNLRQNKSSENLKKLTKYVTELGKEMVQNLRFEQNLTKYENPKFIVSDDNKTYSFNFSGVKEASRHNIFQKGHIEAIFNIPEIIEAAIYIGKEKNEDNRKPNLTNFYYYGLGIKLDNEDYTAKIIFTENKEGEVYYDQSLSTIEKGRFVDIIQKNNLETVLPHIQGRDSSEVSKVLNPLLSQENLNYYYDKRLIRICQVPQMPYLEKDIVTGIWKPTKETVEAVKKGTLFIDKVGQKYVMNDSNLNQKKSNKLHISSTDILTQKINGSDVSVHLSKEEMQKILDEGKKTQNSILHEENEFEPKYVDYEVDCSGMGILSVSNFIEEIENRNNDTILTVNCSDGSAYHTSFDKESWEDFKKAKNSLGTAITKVWVTEEYNRKKHELEEERKLNQELNENIQYLKTPDGELYGFVYNNEIYVDENLVNSNVLAHEYTHVWDNYVQKNNPDLWDKGMVALKNTSLWQEVVNDKNYAELTTDSEILSECHARIVGKMAEKVLNRIAEIDGELTKDTIIDWEKEVSEYIATELLIKPELGDENYISESVKAEYLKEFLAMPMKDLMNEVKLHFEQEHKIENPQKELNEFINNDIPVMPNISDLQHSESNEVQILKKELEDVKAALKQFQSQFEHVSKENSSLRQENELLKGKINNINANQSIKETGEESIYREETKDTGTEINFNRNTAFNINCPIPPFGHKKEDGSIEIIENAHFAKHLLNKYDSASNKVVLTYADESGKHHEIEMHEREYREMINACEEFAEKINGVAENSYEWYLLHEKKAKIMKTDQNVLRLNFASNFIHNYRIMCKLYASNEGEAVKQAQKLFDMMHPNEKRTFNKWRDQVGRKAFDNLLLKEFYDHVQGIENKESLILNNNELLYDVNKRYLEFQKDEEIVLTKNDKVIKNSGKKIGDTIKMAFKYQSFGGKKLKTPMLEYQILKVTKNQSPDTVLLYNAEQKITQIIPLKDFMKHVRKVEKQQLKENAEQIKKDYKIYGFEGR